MAANQSPQRFAHIIGWGKYVPPNVLTNDELAKRVDTSDAWIRERTGIMERRIVTKETTAMLGLYAAQEALEVADVAPNEIDLIIVATSTPEYIFPATASVIQDQLGADNAGAFDLSAACSGFVYALSVGAAMIRSGQHNTALVIGAETFSKILNWKDRATCILFGDGAGALLLRASDQPGGILSTVLGSDGSGGDLLNVPAGGSRNPASLETVMNNLHTVKMNGREVYRFATRVMVDATKQALVKANLPLTELDLLIPHQANARIIDYAARTLQLPPEKVFQNVEHYGNTSAASIPLALVEAIEAKRVNPGDHLVMVGFGGGLSWGSCAVEWTAPTDKRLITPQRAAQSRLRYRWANFKSFSHRVLRRVDSGVTHVLDRIEGRQNGHSG
ncbi:MAG: 3-oxoacyl-[acyl-carrier-protein] synthase 3 [Anaerolineae bacterium]|nr:3-oxoacyl-[acyl-carrier-protein] synthase 3 [Anaerolineae bacterium]RIK33622.1 MAG: 3-oxoacyl-ACP synthase [Chloroflexota bacterium]